MIVIEPMKPEHLDGVLAIEEDCFSIPWTRDSFMRELKDNVLAIYVVARDDSGEGMNIAGYAGMWHVVTEGHITNIAVSPAYRRMGIGDMLVNHITAVAREKGMIGLTLEVRMGNEEAMRLYSKHGFKAEGIRKNYYSDTKEDAVVMWKYLE